MPHAEACLICACEPFVYTSYCAACDVRMLVRQRRDALADEELQRIARSRGSEFAGRVKAQAMHQARFERAR